MSKHIVKEKPFEYLRRKNGDPFSVDTINNWYVAHAYVLEKLKNVTIGPTSKENLHVVVMSDTPLMLSIVRQTALAAHYANFDEKYANRSIITIVSQNKQLVEELQKEEYLCYLPAYCKISVDGEEPINSNSHIDIELQIVKDGQKSAQNGALVISEDDVKVFLATKRNEEIYSIDTRKAILNQRMYSLGSWLDNLPAEDIHCVSRYALALSVFQHGLLREPLTQLVNAKKWESDLTAVKNGLSNVFCSDCFESRRRGVMQYGESQGMKANEAWGACNEALSKSEHGQWVVEKLIMGFRPVNERERYHDECLLESEKIPYRSQLKKNPQDPAHIDICSYAELRRINPEDLKYDSFLMLAIPKILERLKI